MLNFGVDSQLVPWLIVQHFGHTALIANRRGLSAGQVVAATPGINVCNMCSLDWGPVYRHSAEGGEACSCSNRRPRGG